MSGGMIARSHVFGLAAALVAVASTACSRASSRATTTFSEPTVGVRYGDVAAIAKAKADSARLPYTAADVHFMSGMIPHHAQAIVMASWAPTHDASPAIRRLAERIVNAQQDEILLMQQWLADRQQSVPEPRGDGLTVKHGGVEHAMHMSGMLTEAQMKALNQARGADFDRLFLTFMIQHHGGAVQMVQQLFSSYGAGQDETVFKLASDINVDQITEIARMEKMLAELTPTQRNQP
jgi:uncharacterized protein (DUF305 family)